LVFIYALGKTGKPKDIVNTLSFFSKLNLAKHIQRIQILDFEVQVARIPMINAELLQ
jgi:hypothetical protein